MKNNNTRLSKTVIAGLMISAFISAFCLPIYAQAPSLSHIWTYQQDKGDAFGKKDNGLTYGWDQSNTAGAVDRNSPLAVDERYDRFVHMQSGGERIWEMEVPNGRYTVFLVAGDGQETDAHYKIEVEGKLAIDKVPNAIYPWVAGKAVVDVTDGRLTVKSAPGARKNKISYIEIYSSPLDPEEKRYASLPLKVNIGSGKAQGFRGDKEWVENADFGYTLQNFEKAPDGYRESTPTFWTGHKNPFTTFVHKTDENIKDTELDSVFGTSRSGSYGYKVRVKNGTYYVKMLFADFERDRPGRKMGFSINGTPISQSPFDIAKETEGGGVFQVQEKITVTDEMIEITIEDMAAWSEPMMNGLIVSETPVSLEPFTEPITTATSFPEINIYMQAVQLHNGKPGDIIRLTGPDGKVVQHWKVKTPDETTSLKSMPPGIYFLQYLRDGKPLLNQRFVPMRANWLAF